MMHLATSISTEFHSSAKFNLSRNPTCREIVITLTPAAFNLPHAPTIPHPPAECPFPTSGQNSAHFLALSHPPFPAQSFTDFCHPPKLNSNGINIPLSLSLPRSAIPLLSPCPKVTITKIEKRKSEKEKEIQKQKSKSKTKIGKGKGNTKTKSKSKNENRKGKGNTKMNSKSKNENRRIGKYKWKIRKRKSKNQKSENRKKEKEIQNRNMKIGKRKSIGKGNRKYEK